MTSSGAVACCSWIPLTSKHHDYLYSTSANRSRSPKSYTLDLELMLLPYKEQNVQLHYWAQDLWGKHLMQSLHFLFPSKDRKHPALTLKMHILSIHGFVFHNSFKYALHNSCRIHNDHLLCATHTQLLICKKAAGVCFFFFFFKMEIFFTQQCFPV